MAIKFNGQDFDISTGDRWIVYRDAEHINQPGSTNLGSCYTTKLDATTPTGSSSNTTIDLVTDNFVTIFEKEEDADIGIILCSSHTSGLPVVSPSSYWEIDADIDWTRPLKYTVAYKPPTQATLSTSFSSKYATFSGILPPLAVPGECAIISTWEAEHDSHTLSWPAFRVILGKDASKGNILYGAIRFGAGIYFVVEGLSVTLAQPAVYVKGSIATPANTTNKITISLPGPCLNNEYLANLDITTGGNSYVKTTFNQTSSGYVAELSYGYTASWGGGVWQTSSWPSCNVSYMFLCAPPNAKLS